MGKYIIPGGYDKCDAEFIRKKLSESAKIIFNETAGIKVSIIPEFVSGNNIIVEDGRYSISINSNNCVDNNVLMNWATEEIVVGYCRAAEREHGVL